MTSKTTIYETKLNDGWINQIIVYDPEIDTYPFIDFKFKKETRKMKCLLCPYSCHRWEWLSNHYYSMHKKIDVCMELAKKEIEK